MEQRRPDSVRTPGSRSIGPYHLITRLDPTGPGRPPVPEHRFIASTADGARTVLLSTPLPGADPARFAAEAAAGRAMPGPWVAGAAELAGPGEPPWYAAPYLPVLPLAAALDVRGGPLPERTVRALGAVLAETLAAAHAQGLTHAGISPAAVLLAGDGPRLTCFGAARVAAPDGERRDGLPGLSPSCLAPEQASGGRPRPPGDCYALGAVLSYAATGHTVPERSELPSSLRALISSCLTRDPADRPTAAALVAELAPPGTPGTFQGPGPGPSPAVSLLSPGWLPGRIIAALAQQSAALLAADISLPRPRS